MRTLGLSVRQVDDRLSSLLWALRLNAEETADRIPTRENLWVAVTKEEPPLFRVYLRSREDVPDECELLWIEERPVDD
jgi:hypothetical protein